MSLTVTDGEAEDTASEAVAVTEPVVPNEAPEAVIAGGETLDVTAKRGTARVRLDGRGSYDPDGDALTYVWTRDGEVVGTAARLQERLSSGTYEYELTVTDPGGLSGSDTVTVTVK